MPTSKAKIVSGAQNITKVFLIEAQNLGKGATAPSAVFVGNYNTVEYGINDDSVFNFDIPDDWGTGSDIIIKAHWQIDEAFVTNSGEIRWSAAWSATPPDNTEVLDSPTHTGSGNSGDINIPAAAKTLREDNVVTLSGASLSPGDCVGVTISRVAVDGGTPNPAAEPGIVMLHIHYTSDNLGGND
ncbi:hypothetical protein LCGC14_1238750 [marine sediment metagenome]|uniref:Uncharacterized protein n=1 Tax=marine sediment metagenome TaxID=412755 RepID=A0A0F9LAJ2_9ZZZZ